MTHVLVVEDDPSLRRSLTLNLTARGYSVDETGNGEDALKLAGRRLPDVLFLDLGLPGMSGLEVIRGVRAWADIPIIVLSARGAERDKVEALDAGATDYVTKPFGIEELVARVRVALRARPQAPSQTAYSHGPLALDLARRRVTLAGEPLKLSKTEFDLLALLMRHAGMVLTHRQLLREIWGPEHEDDVQYLRVYVGQLRQKLGDDPSAPRFIANEQGVGYRFVDDAH
jgi:two-component system KDP operon response regulator KdpE